MKIPLVTEAMAALQNHSISNARFFSRGVDTGLFHPAKRSSDLRARWGAGPDDPIVLTVSRVTAEKNLPLVARAFSAIRECLPSAKLVFVGDGPALNRMRRIFPEHIYCGFKYDEDLAQHYASADLFLFASQTETFGNVLTEAMASGLPIVAYNHVVPRLFLKDGRNGFLATSGSEQRLIDRSRDAALGRPQWREMGHAARLNALKIPWTNELAQFETDFLDTEADDGGNSR